VVSGLGGRKGEACAAEQQKDELRAERIVRLELSLRNSTIGEDRIVSSAGKRQRKRKSFELTNFPTDHYSEPKHDIGSAQSVLSITAVQL